MKTRKVSFIQIIAAQWTGESGDITYSLYGLTQAGNVYRKQNGGWKAVPMDFWEEE